MFRSASGRVTRHPIDLEGHVCLEARHKILPEHAACCANHNHNPSRDSKNDASVTVNNMGSSQPRSSPEATGLNVESPVIRQPHSDRVKSSCRPTHAVYKPVNSSQLRVLQASLVTPTAPHTHAVTITTPATEAFPCVQPRVLRQPYLVLFRAW